VTSQRRLAAIMLTDMVGYSALTQRDEALALRLLDEHCLLVREALRSHQGREVKTLGDGFLVEFESALDAVDCAVDIQRRFEERNRAHGPERILLRIGLHLGDVVHDGGDVLGDAVNIAARLEPLAEPGGILVSGTVFEQVRGKTDVAFQPVAAPKLKNLEFPVAVYRVELPWHGAAVGGMGRVTPWTDREAERALGRAAVERARRGEPGIVLLQGGAGVGKTRLAEEYLQEAERAGFRVLSARAFRNEEGSPYGVWARLLRSFARDAPVELLRQACGGTADEIAKLAPEVRDRLGPLPPPPELDPEGAKRRFLEGVSQAFLHLAVSRPLAILLDDLQWIDPASQTLLEILARQFARQPLLVVAAFREGDPKESPGLGRLLVELRRERHLEVVPVRRFDRAEFEQLLGAMLQPSALDPPTLDLLFGKSGGNPFFAEEIVRKLVTDGALHLAEGGWQLRPGVSLHLPDSIRALLRERLDGLDPPTLQMLRVASAAGRAFPTELLGKVAGLDEDAFLTAIERAYQQGILVERRLGPGRSVMAFADPQVEQALYEEIPPLLRHRIHRNLAVELEGLGDAAGGRRAAELARHYIEANDPVKALRYVRRAAENAEAVFAREDARRYYETALELLTEHPDDLASAEILEALGAQLEALGQPRGAIRCWGDAVSLRTKTGNLKAAANLERRQGYAERQYLQDSKAALAALESARAKLEPLGDSVELASVYGDLADLYWYDRQAADARTMCERALALAKRTGAYDTEGWSYLILAALVPPDRVDEMFGYLERMLRLGKEHRLSEVIFGAYHNLAAASYYCRGDHREALRLIAEGADFARSVRSRPGEMLLEARLAPLVLAASGALDRAEAGARAMLDYVGLFSPRAEPMSLGIQGQIALVRGDLDRAEAFAHRALDVLRHSPDWSVHEVVDAVLGGAYLERGAPERAIAAIADSIRGTRAMGFSAWGISSYLRLSSQLAEALSRGGRTREGLPSLAELREEAAHWAAVAGVLPVRAFAAEIRATSDREQGRFEEAATGFAEAAETWGRLGMPYEHARVLRRRASLLEERGRKEEGAADRRESARLLEAIGVRPRGGGT
jgi:class 3 adenylate cyclase/tetratricopeptide (TPR) repeat protein